MNSFNNTLSRGICIAVLTISGSAATFAADLDPEIQASPITESQKPSFYGSIFGGANFDVGSTDFTNGTTIVDTEFDTGFTVGGAVGYKWNHFNFGGFTPRTEIEVNYFDNDVDTIDFSGNGVGQEVVNGDSGVSGVGVFANLFFDLDTGTKFTPYVGGGVGVGFLDLDVFYNGPNLNLDDTDTAFGWHIGGGANLELTESTSFFVDARYQQFVNVDSLRRIGEAPVGGGTGPGGGDFEDDLASVLVRAGLTYRF
ncbi:MAG: outer membrane beta-barrel protein [Hyphomicrobiales bacterium]